LQHNGGATAAQRVRITLWHDVVYGKGKPISVVMGEARAGPKGRLCGLETFLRLWD